MGAWWIASQTAMNVTRRSFLAGHNGAWVDERRDELGAVYTRALATLAAASLELGETGAADRRESGARVGRRRAVERGRDGATDAGTRRAG